MHISKWNQYCIKMANSGWNCTDITALCVGVDSSPRNTQGFVLGAAHPAGAGLEAAALCSLQSSRAPGLGH